MRKLIVTLILLAALAVPAWAQKSGNPFEGGTASGAPFSDGSALVKNNADNTKQLIISAASIATTTTRTLTAPNVSGTIGLVNATSGKVPVNSSGSYADSPIVVSGNNIGFGVASPQASLHVEASGYWNPFILKGSDVTYAAMRFLNTTSGFNYWRLGETGSTSYAGTPAGAFSFSDETSTIYQVWTRNGRVGFSVANPSHPLQVASGAHVTSAGVWTDASDKRLKNNITGISYGLNEVMKLRPVSYRMVRGNTAQIGFIAQEVKEILPEVVSGTEGEVDKGQTLGIGYGGIVAALTRAVQEQQKQIEALEGRLSKLEKKQ